MAAPSRAAQEPPQGKLSPTRLSKRGMGSSGASADRKAPGRRRRRSYWNVPTKRADRSLLMYTTATDAERDIDAMSYGPERASALCRWCNRPARSFAKSPAKLNRSFSEWRNDRFGSFATGSSQRQPAHRVEVGTGDTTILAFRILKAVLRGKIAPSPPRPRCGSPARGVLKASDRREALPQDPLLPFEAKSSVLSPRSIMRPRRHSTNPILPADRTCAAHHHSRRLWDLSMHLLPSPGRHHRLPAAGSGRAFALRLPAFS